MAGGVRISAENQGYSSIGTVPGATHTMTCWARIMVDRNAYSTIYEPSDGTTGNYIQCGTNGTGTALGAHTPDASNPSPSYVPSVGDWFFFVITRTPSLMTIKAGATPGSLTTASGVTGSYSGVDRITLGWSDAWAGEWFNGEIAAVKLWNAALSDAEIETEGGFWLPSRTSGLLRAHFMEGANTTDYSGNGNPLVAGAGSASTVAGPTGLVYDPHATGTPTSPRFFLGYV